MTEGGATRMKRNSARLFKNPPQPHMCIQDFIRGAGVPCYVNVLSWDKVAMPLKLSAPLQFYGGMRVRPPRTKEEAVIFAVMANPEVLRISGKNAQDPKKRSSLIKLLLDFVERMNVGVVFTRQYTILKDRDITGELKEVWNAVQARRDVPPIPQYPQYQNHQQDYTSQPPQYHSSVAYGRSISRSNNGMHYESYGHQPQNPVITQTDQIYQTGQLVPQQYHGNVPRITSTASRDRRDNIVPNMPQQNCPAYPAPQYQFQQLPRQMVPQYVNSNVHPNANLNYGPGSNANVNPAMNTNLAVPFQPYTTFEQQRDNGISMDMRRLQPQNQQMHLNRVQPVLQYKPKGSYYYEQVGSCRVLTVRRPHMGVAQKKRQPIHFKRCAYATCLNKDTSDNGTKPTNPVKVLQRELPSNDRQDTNNHIAIDNSKMHVDKITIEDTNDIQVTDLDEEVKKNNDFDDETIEIPRKPSDTHMSSSILANTARDGINCVDDTEYESKTSYYFEQVGSCKVLTVRRPHMGVAQKKRQPIHSKRWACATCRSKDTSDNDTKPMNTVKVLQPELPSNDGQDTNNHITIDNNKIHAEKISVEDMRNIQVTDLDEEVKKNNDFDGETFEVPRKPTDTHMTSSILVNTARDGINCIDDTPALEEKQHEIKNTDIQNGKNSSDQKYSKSKTITIKGNKHKENTENNRLMRNRLASDPKNDNPKRSQSTVNSIIKSVFKIHPGMSNYDTSNKRKANGQAKNNAKINGEPEEAPQSYTILKKTDSTTPEELASELAQLTIQDCKDATEVSPVLS